MVKQDDPRRSSKRFYHVDPSPLPSPVTSPSPPNPDSVYLHAASIFRNALQEKGATRQLISYGKRPDVAVPKFKDEAWQRRAYELAFNTLKYQELLEDIMIDSCFYLSKPVPDDLMSLVAILLYDFQDRKFLPRERLPCHDTKEAESAVREVEECLLRFKTKLAASLARCRIKHNLQSIDSILPKSVRQRQERESNLPIYTWVNTLHTSMEEVCDVLKSAGFSHVSSFKQLEKQTFCNDLHCLNLLVFPACVRQELHKTSLLKDYRLVIQDKSCCVGPLALRPLLVPDGDVLMAGSFSTLSVAHTAAIVASVQTNASQNSGKQTRAGSRVFVCTGERSSAQRDELQEGLTSMGCSNVKLLPETLHSLSACDVRLQKVQLILLTPQCSLSAVSNPIDYLLQENGGTELLQNLSQGSVSQERLDALASQQKRDLQHALRFPKVQAVVYSTCSSLPEENEEVVKSALTLSEQNSTSKLQPFRLTRPSLLHCDEEDGSGEMKADFFRLQASDQSNGCFLAVLTRQPDPEAIETPQDVIARAVATGLLDGIETSQPVKKEGRRRKTRKRAAKQARPAHPQTRASLVSQSQVEEFLNREMKASSSTLVQAQEKTNNTHTHQGKAKPVHQHKSKPASFITCPALSNTRSASSSITVSIVSTKASAPSASSAPGCIGYTTVPAPDRHQNRTDSRRANGHVVPPPAPPRGRHEVLRPVLLTFPPALFPALPHPSTPVRNNPTLSYLHSRNWPHPAPPRHVRSTYPRTWL